MKRWTLVLLLPLVAACGKPAEAPRDLPPPPPEPPAEAAHSRVAQVLVVDLAGDPLAGMVPIVTRRPNAFDTPVAKGPPTTADGMSSVNVPADEDVYVRAWDDSLGHFANNYLTVTAGDGAIAEVLTVQMVQSAAATVQVVLPGGEFAAEEEMLLRLYHPTEGEWWPAPGTADTNGIVRFAPIPAGAYTFDLVTRSGYGIEIPQRLLPPGETADLGVVVVMPRDNSANKQDSP